MTKTLFSKAFAGKTVSLPHAESGGPIRFADDGKVTLKDEVADELLYHFDELILEVSTPKGRKGGEK